MWNFAYFLGCAVLLWGVLYLATLPLIFPFSRAHLRRIQEFARQRWDHDLPQQPPHVYEEVGEFAVTSDRRMWRGLKVVQLTVVAVAVLVSALLFLV